MKICIKFYEIKGGMVIIAHSLGQFGYFCNSHIANEKSAGKSVFLLSVILRGPKLWAKAGNPYPTTNRTIRVDLIMVATRIKCWPSTWHRSESPVKVSVSF
jgi:hypothetical protein